MVALPWQIIVAFVALFGVNLLLSHFRKTDCDERIEAAKRQQHRDTQATYRDAYKAGWDQGKQDGSDA